MSDITPIEAIQRLLDEGGDAYQDIVALAMSSEGDMSRRRFLLGDLALLVRKSYGRNRMAAFATAAGIARSTMSQYKSVSQHYPEEVRYVYPNIGYAIYRAAMRLKEDSLVFLAEASNNGYTVEEAQIRIQERLGKQAPPMMLLDAEGCIGHVNPWNSDMVIQLAEGVDVFAIEKLQGKNVRIKIYELEGK